jgi:hypothetical protein
MKRKSKWEDSWIDGGFVAITFQMINSKAYKELTGSAIKALILCMRKVKEQHRTERFQAIFSLTYPEARKQGLCDGTFWRAMKLLQRVGFIDCTIKGGLTGRIKKTPSAHNYKLPVKWKEKEFGKTPSAYRLSLRWKEYGTPAFEDRHPGYCETINGNDEPF